MTSEKHKKLCEELIRCQKRTIRTYKIFKKAREAEISAAMAVKSFALSKSRDPVR
jgi:hypothetical protein